MTKLSLIAATVLSLWMVADRLEEAVHLGPPAQEVGR